MKNVLGLVGSPRKNGNTHVLVAKILEGAKTAGANSEIILLRDQKITECDGCHACWKNGNCCKKDDMCAIYRKIAASDVLVFGTPVYWYGPTALMKALIDRFVFFNCPKNRKKIKGKGAILVIPFEESDPKTARLVVGFFKKSFAYLQIDLLDVLLVPGVTKRGEVKKNKRLMNNAFLLGTKIGNSNTKH